MSNSKKGKNNPRYGKKMSKEEIEKRTLLQMGQKRSEETKQKISQSNVGKKRSEETKKNLSISHIGKKQTEETINKRSKKMIGKKLKNTTSKYMGVYFDRTRNKWATKINFNKKSVYIGRFNTEIEAALAYNAKAIELYSADAKLNIIENKVD